MVVAITSIFNEDTGKKKRFIGLINSCFWYKSPAAAKKLGRAIRNFNQKVWEEHRFEIVKMANYHKFNQNEELKTFLLQTKKRVLVEASPMDKIWGIGLAFDNEHASNPKKWKGLNLLGFALMEIRDQLIENK